MGQWYGMKYANKTEFLNELRHLYRLSKPAFQAWNDMARRIELERTLGNDREQPDK